MTVTELLDRDKTLAKRNQELVDNAKKESRMMTNDEEKEFINNQNERNQIRIDVQTISEEMRTSFKPLKHEKVEGFSLCRSIRQLMAGEKAEENDTLAEGRASFRTSVSNNAIYIPMKRAALTAKSDTGVNIDEEQQELLLPLLPNLVLSQVGARIMTGLKGDISFPSVSSASVTWEGENASSKDANISFKKGNKFSPKRLTAHIDISKQLLLQENRDVEAIVRQILANTIAQKIEATVFSKAPHAENVPDGLFKDTITDKGAMTWARVVGMETNAAYNNALYGNLAYIMHPSLLDKAKTVVKDASGAGGFIANNEGGGFLNGYKALRTTNIPDKLNTDEFGIVFGDWSQYFIGQWGSIEILVDPYTQATNGFTRLVVNSYWDMGQIRKESFSIASMK